MRTIAIVFLLFISFSCSTNKSPTTSQKNKVSMASTTKDCTENIKAYVRNNEGLITNSTDRFTVSKVSKLSSDSYNAQLRWESGNLNGQSFVKTFLVDKNCRVMRVK